jgi:hypothetical protein
MTRCEAEIDEIRLKLYEETKHLTQEERTKLINDRAQILASQFGFTIVQSANNPIPITKE